MGWDAAIDAALNPVDEHHFFAARRFYQPFEVQELDTNHSVKIGYKNVSGSYSYQVPYAAPGVTPVTAAAIDSIEFSNGEKFKFEYEPHRYIPTHQALAVGSSSTVLSNGLVWSVSSLTHSDVHSQGVRITTYERNFPQMVNVPPTPATFTDLRFWEAETRADNSVVVRKFIPPAAESLLALTSGILLPLEAQIQNYLFAKNTHYESRTYAPGAPWRSEVDQDGASNAHAVEIHDLWGLHQLGVPSGIPALGGMPRPTRSIRWNKLSGVANLIQQQGWDPSSQAWTQSRESVGFSAPGEFCGRTAYMMSEIAG